MKRWYLCSIAVLAVSAETGEAEFPTLRARPKTLPGLPPYPYAPTSGQPKPTVTGTSFPRLDLGDGTELKLNLATETATVTAQVRRQHVGKGPGRDEPASGDGQDDVRLIARGSYQYRQFLDRLAEQRPGEDLVLVAIGCVLIGTGHGRSP